MFVLATSHLMRLVLTVALLSPYILELYISRSGTDSSLFGWLAGCGTVTMCIVVFLALNALVKSLACCIKNRDSQHRFDEFAAMEETPRSSQFREVVDSSWCSKYRKGGSFSLLKVCHARLCDS